LARKKKTTKMKRERPLFLVDYDLPRSRCRTDFYKNLKNPKFEGIKSTRSVILSNDFEKAKIIHKQASKCGTSHLYEVKKLKLP
jgi:hypothetical protein